MTRKKKKHEQAPDPEQRAEEKDDQEEEGDESDEAYQEEAEEDAPGETSRSTSEWSAGSGKSDVDLIERFLSGDDEAFASLVIKYQHRVHNLCFRILGDRDEAMDISQEVFLTVHKSLKYFRGESLFSTWVFRVTVNHCKNRIKYLGRRRYYHSVSLDQPQELIDGEMYYEPEDSSPDPEDILAGGEIQDLVQNAISTLDADHRIVIVLRDIQDLPYEEIAEIVGIKVGTVKSRIHRARNELKKMLAGKLGRAD